MRTRRGSVNETSLCTYDTLAHETNREKALVGLKDGETCPAIKLSLRTNKRTTINDWVSPSTKYKSNTTQCECKLLPSIPNLDLQAHPPRTRPHTPTNLDG